MRIFQALFIVSIVFSTASAEIISTPIEGTFNNSQENACIHVSTFFFLTDCFYSRNNEESGGQKLPWTGPTVNPVYYALNSEHTDPNKPPTPDDDRIAPTMTGTLHIDDRLTESGDDDKISGTLIVGPAARTVVVNVNELAGGPGGAPPRAVMSWSSIKHELAPTEVNSVSVNEFGGFDYIIASKGFPKLLCRVEDPDDCYPSARAGKTTDGQAAEGTWDGPSPYGVTRDTAMEGNIGARTSAVINDYRCIDNRNQITCPNHNVVWSTGEENPPGTRNHREGPGLDNLLLKVVTDEAGRVIKAEGFWTNEYFIQGGPRIFQVPEGHDNSYQGGYMQMRGIDPTEE